MSLGFDLSLTRTARRRVATPWWHAYRAGQTGPLPAVVFEAGSGRLHGGTFADPTTIDLGALSLDAGFALFVQGRFTYTLGDPGTQRLAWVGTQGTDANRHVVFLTESVGAINVVAVNQGTQMFNARVVFSGQPSDQTCKIAAQFRPDDYVACHDHGPLHTDNAGSLPPGLNRLFLGTDVDCAVLWTDPVDPVDLQAFAP